MLTGRAQSLLVIVVLESVYGLAESQKEDTCDSCRASTDREDKLRNKGIQGTDAQG